MIAEQKPTYKKNKSRRVFLITNLSSSAHYDSKNKTRITRGHEVPADEAVFGHPAGAQLLFRLRRGNS